MPPASSTRRRGQPKSATPASRFSSGAPAPAAGIRALTRRTAPRGAGSHLKSGELLERPAGVQVDQRARITDVGFGTARLSTRVLTDPCLLVAELRLER